VYANVKGMSKAYKDASILSEQYVFGEFVQGFNMADPLCDFVDAGTGKECSDEKLKGKEKPHLTPKALADNLSENFKLHIADIHCKRVIFAGSADNGYARLLGPYSTDGEQAKRVTMLEGPPFAKELKDLVQKFATTSFETVFRKSKLPSQRVSSSITPPASPAANYSGAIVHGLPPRPSTVTPSQSDSSREVAPIVLRNSKGQRVDSQLRYTSTDVSILIKKKLCNPYYLRGRCPYVKCSHPHNEKLSSKQLEALRHIARLSHCNSGLECRDAFCIYGHQCPFEGCTGGAACRFPRVMHGVDTKVA
jgi:hypothetical protein